jgi:hypothetical protein
LTTPTLGRLTRVDLREIWISETSDFTPWLAREENLVVLADTLGIDLELEAQEKAVGPFRADILCKDIGSGAWVLVENQLERTDHGHLGQLLTYASGLEAVTIVWIAARFRNVCNMPRKRPKEQEFRSAKRQPTFQRRLPWMLLSQRS